MPPTRCLVDPGTDEADIAAIIAAMQVTGVSSPKERVLVATAVSPSPVVRHTATVVDPCVDDVDVESPAPAASVVRRTATVVDPCAGDVDVESPAPVVAAVSPSPSDEKSQWVDDRWYASAMGLLSGSDVSSDVGSLQSDT